MLALLPYLKWLHILGAIAALGANFTYPIWLRLARRDPVATRFTLHGIESVEKVANLGYALLFLTGVAMLLVGNIPWSTPWVLSSLVLFAVVGFIAGVLYIPVQKKQNALADKATSPEYLAAEERTNRIGILVILLVVLIEFLMTVKPRLWG
ncbi:MAG: DUF2269 family protein [Anaerolineales bacterium]